MYEVNRRGLKLWIRMRVVEPVDGQSSTERWLGAGSGTAGEVESFGSNCQDSGCEIIGCTNVCCCC